MAVMRHISRQVLATKQETRDGEPYLLANLEGPGGAPNDTIIVAISFDVARQLGDAAGYGYGPVMSGPIPLEDVASWYESFMGPVFGGANALERVRERRRKTAADFADKVTQAFPGILQDPKKFDYYESHKVLGEIVNLMAEQQALNGAGPEWPERWTRVLARAGDLVGDGM
jgi:hypothetical protein